jgi:predicted Zn-dependent protease
MAQSGRRRNPRYDFTPRSGSFDPARADLDRAIELEPKNAFAFLARDNLKIGQNVWAEALADFNQAIGLRQDLAPAIVGRARAYLETAQLDSALGDLNTDARRLAGPRPARAGLSVPGKA